jgi:hypothetical protein
MIIPPYYFDVFGVFVFAYLVYVFYRLLKKKPVGKKELVLGLLIALAGLAVDLVVVFNYFLI